MYKSPELCNNTTGDNSLVLYYLEEDALSVDVFFPLEYRTVADFRALNAVTVPDRSPLHLA